ncbi:Flp family type IVb pilin [Sphingomonas sp.]|uniref:Flp family type IVb pilin n=1 Tax=Sphingomonas sp. TaxID=28214 RepID=UPI0031D6C99A
MKALPLLLALMRRIGADRRGAAAVEYALLIAGIMLTIFVALSQLGVSLQNVANYLSAYLNASTA